MKKVMIVDDEVLVRIGIKSLIKWEAYDYQIVCDASDGEEALEKMEQYRPDIVLTDLKMNPVDGFELIERGREKYPHTQFIVLSSYNDFDNVRAAMKLGAYDYVFKLTVKPEELLKIMEEASRAVNKAGLDAGNTEIQYKNLDVIKKDLIRKILNSEIFLSRNQKELQTLPLAVSFEQAYRVLYIKLDNFRVIRKKGDFMDLELLRFTMENILNEIFNRSSTAEVFQHIDYDFILVIDSSEVQADGAFLSGIKKEFEIFVQYAKQYYGIEISGALSEQFTGIEYLKSAIEQTGDILEHRFFSESGKLHHYGKIKRETAVVPGEFRMSELERLASSLDWYGVESFLEQFMEFLSQQENWNPSEIRYLLRKIYRILSVAFARCNIDIDVFTDKNGAGMESAINDYTFFQKIRLAMMELFGQYRQQYERNRGAGCRKEIAEVKGYVQNHMREELPLSDAAGLVNMSESHFSHTFKKETGISFVEYVNQVRMDQAKYLLKTSDLKINEIADEVGIYNPNYFSTQFKKRTGLSPLEFRQDYINKSQGRRI